MGRLARQFQMALQIGIERHAIRQQIVNPVRSFRRHHSGDFLIHQSRSGGNRISHMGFGAVTGRHGSGNSALGPC